MRLFVKYNANPKNRNAIDCTVRAISVVTGKSWHEVYIGLCVKGYEMCEMPSSNSVWGTYLTDIGYVRRMLPDTCPVCYSIREFCKDHPHGRYIVGTGTHVVAVTEGGNYVDTWDSGDETALFYFTEVRDA